MTPKPGAGGAIGWRPADRRLHNGQARAKGCDLLVGICDWDRSVANAVAAAVSVALSQWVARSHYGRRDGASGLAASDFDGPVFDGSGGDEAVAVLR